MIQDSDGSSTCGVRYPRVLIDSFVQDRRFQIHGYSVELELDKAGLSSMPKSGQLDVSGACIPATIEQAVGEGPWYWCSFESTVSRDCGSDRIRDLFVDDISD